jgi:tetratricopeptide (TPR) repeat protein
MKKENRTIASKRAQAEPPLFLHRLSGKAAPAVRGLLIAGLVILASCQSLQKDMLISSAEVTENVDLAALEEQILSLEGEIFDVPGSSRELTGRINSVRRKITEIERKKLPDPASAALLAAWSGRLYLLEKKPSDAAKQLNISQSLEAGNQSALILAIRLETDVAKQLELIDKTLQQEDNSPNSSVWVQVLQIEKGRFLYERRRFQEAAASFDIAFNIQSGAGELYRIIYQDVRDRAWEMRNLGSAERKTLEITRKDGMSWRELIELTNTETDLLRFLTTGRDRPSEELFSLLLDRSFIPYTQNVALTEWPQVKPRADEAVLRSGAAWFLWHLWAETHRDKGLLSMYSSRYANRGNARSPIPDLPFLSPFFDSILGCIETELISLPDGRNFLPDDTVGGSSFLTMLRKIR